MAVSVVMCMAESRAMSVTMATYDCMLEEPHEKTSSIISITSTSFLRNLWQANTAVKSSKVEASTRNVLISIKVEGGLASAPRSSILVFFLV